MYQGGGDVMAMMAWRRREIKKWRKFALRVITRAAALARMAIAKMPNMMRACEINELTRCNAAARVTRTRRICIFMAFCCWRTRCAK